MAVGRRYDLSMREHSLDARTHRWTLKLTARKSDKTPRRTDAGNTMKHQRHSELRLLCLASASTKTRPPHAARAPCWNAIFARCQFLAFYPVFQVLPCGCSESSRLAQRHPKVFYQVHRRGARRLRLARTISGKKFVPRVQYATHFSARRSVEHALLVAY